MAEKAYKDTLNLPATEFPMKANLPQREPEILARWQQAGLYGRMVAGNAGRPRFLFHDGPPYANGHLHAGHVLNKVLKDIIVKQKNLAGLLTEFVPGWDCHGLPIEREVEKEVGRALKHTDPVAFRRACRAYAQKFVAIQRKEFERLGCVGDYDHPYLTMTNGYEARILEELGKVVASGAVYRGKKPVYWCADCETALAEAEVEYHDHSSPSIYVRFPLNDAARERLHVPAGEPASVVIWTTTPWTLPANLGVAFHPDHTYVAARVGAEVILVAEYLLPAVKQQLKVEAHEIVTSLQGRELEGLSARHPFLDRDSAFVLADYVTLDTGTGCVHTAPGHGQEDYETGVRYGLPPYSPVDDKGRFTREVGVPGFEGRLVFDTNDDVCTLLAERGLLVGKQVIAHSYPHCWRSKTPVIFRATTQWFASMERTGLREKALDQIQNHVQWLPSWGKDRIQGMVANRPDWCLSRQRHWGVPIAALRCTACGEVFTTPELFQHLVPLFEERGADAWFDLPVEALVPAGTACPQCGGQAFARERDILDVWFDSGVSYAAVMEATHGPDTITDLYLEGSDQHRGWFHSALLHSTLTRGRAPYKTVLTHGFTVDGEGKKLSKSAGNYVLPEEIIKKHGAEVLRLWVASEDYRNDVSISDEILNGLADAYRKIRNTIRFLLANLGDFRPERDGVPDARLDVLDRLMKAKAREAFTAMHEAYEAYEFHKVVAGVLNFMTGPLSAMYLDFLKDRLYAERADDPRRRSSQTVLHGIAHDVLVLLSPIVSFTADEAWQLIPRAPGEPDTVFLATWPEAASRPLTDAERADAQRWNQLAAVRVVVSKALEEVRTAKIIGHTLEAAVTLRVAPGSALLEAVTDLGPALREALIVSKLDVVEAPVAAADGVEAVVAVAPGTKCERCWTRSASVGASASHPTLCARCVGVLENRA
jgi:isoleucyl-tRNA synthetase